MGDSAPKAIFTGVVTTVVGGLVLWWATTALDHSEKNDHPARSSSSPTVGYPAPTRANLPGGEGVWLGFANEIVTQDRDAELRSRCGDFKRVYVPVEAGNNFIDLCNRQNRACERVCDWQGRVLPCSAISLGGRRDGTRIALCR